MTPRKEDEDQRIKREQTHRREMLEKLIEVFSLDTGDDTCAGEDIQPFRDGEELIAKFAAITQGGNVRYIYPLYSELEHAREKAIENITDNIYAEFPVAVVNMDTGDATVPNWGLLLWRKAGGA